MSAHRIQTIALLVALIGALTAGPAAAPASAAEPTLAQLVGQTLVNRMNGTSPSTSLLGRVRRGEVGGIVLFRCCNITTEGALSAAITKLQAAAAAGGQPPLLVMADQ